MSQSASASDSDDGPPMVGNAGPVFAYQTYYHSADDKAKIDSLPEIEREQILADRSSKVEEYQQNMALQHLLASRAKEAKEEADKKKRKIGATDLEEGQRKSSRQRTTLGGRKAGERNETIEAYKKTRETRRDEQRLRGAGSRKDRVRNTSSGNDSDSLDADGDYDSDAKGSVKATPPPKDEPLAEIQDIQRAKIGRLNFAQVVYNPGFDKAVEGCYARICIGPSERVPGTNEYRLARIEKIVTGRPYAMEAPNGRMMPVEKYILASVGKAQRAWALLECSMDRVQDNEWRRYQITLANENISLPTQRAVNAKLDDLGRLIKHRFTDADINEKMNAQEELRNKIYRTAEREPLIEKRNQALARGDEEEAQKYDDELADIVPMKLAYNTSLSKNEVKVVDKQQLAIMEHNRRAARMDEENVRKAQIAESRLRRRIIPKSSNPKNKLDDLFEGSDGSRAGTPVNGISTPRPGTPANGARNSSPAPAMMQTRPVTVSKSGLPVIRKALLDEEIKRQVIQNLDLNIDIEI